MPITDSIGQLIEGVSFVFGRLCSCHSVIALGGQFSWNWSKVAVNRDLLNVERAVWFPVFWTCHRPHHVSGVRGPGNGPLFFRWIAYVIYSGSRLIPLRRSPSATAISLMKWSSFSNPCYPFYYAHCCIWIMKLQSSLCSRPSSRGHERLNVITMADVNTWISMVISHRKCHIPRFCVSLMQVSMCISISNCFSDNVSFWRVMSYVYEVTSCVR